MTENSNIGGSKLKFLNIFPLSFLCVFSENRWSVFFHAITADVNVWKSCQYEWQITSLGFPAYIHYTHILKCCPSVAHCHKVYSQETHQLSAKSHSSHRFVCIINRLSAKVILVLTLLTLA